jgi:hypothetical protein
LSKPAKSRSTMRCFFGSGSASPGTPSSGWSRRHADSAPHGPSPMTPQCDGSQRAEGERRDSNPRPPGPQPLRWGAVGAGFRLLEQCYLLLVRPTFSQFGPTNGPMANKAHVEPDRAITWDTAPPRSTRLRRADVTCVFALLCVGGRRRQASDAGLCVRLRLFVPIRARSAVPSSSSASMSGVAWAVPVAIVSGEPSGRRHFV